MLTQQHFLPYVHTYILYTVSISNVAQTVLGPVFPQQINLVLI